MTTSHRCVSLFGLLFLAGLARLALAQTEMVLLPAGSNSGTNPLGSGESFDDPSHYPSNYTVALPAPLWMDKWVVAKQKWDAVRTWAVTNGYVFDNAGMGKSAAHPVHMVNWYDCVKWCNARSEQEGLAPCYRVGGEAYRAGRVRPECDFDAAGYRLPTSEEWEYAARGGTASLRYPWGNSITHSNANYYSDAHFSYDVSATRRYHPDYDLEALPYTSGYLSPAGAFPANAFALHDLIGNVWQFCWDTLGDAPYIRGGCWFAFANVARCGYRGLAHPVYASYDRSFRTVRRAAPE